MSVASEQGSPQSLIEPTPPVAAVSAEGLRLVPALVGGHRIWIEHPDWCVMDHVAENERHLEDVAHSGSMTDLVVPGGEPAYRLLAHVRLGADFFAPRAEDRGPFVVIDDESEGHHLTPAQADEFAVRLITFAEAVRALARVAGGQA